jgi:hypothetical protein
VDGPQPSTGRPDAAALAARYIDDFLLRERLKADHAFLAKELQRLRSTVQAGSTAPGLLDGFRQLDPATGQTLVGVLQENGRPLVQELDHAAARLRGQVQRAGDTWQSARTALSEARFLLFEVEGSRRVAGQMASLLNADNRWFWLCGAAAIAGVLGVAFHERRHEIRRMLSGGRARAMRLSKLLAAALALLILITLATFLLGDRIYDSLLSISAGGEASPRSAMVAESAALEEEIEPLQAVCRDLQRQYAAAEAAQRQKLAESLPPASTLPAEWREFRGRIREIVVESALLESLPQVVAADLAALRDLREQLDAHAAATARLLRLKQWIRGLLGLALLGLAGAGGTLFWRSVQLRRRTTANTCPLCLGLGKLESVPESSPPAGADPPGCTLVQCKNLISRSPREECDYTFLSVYRGMEKLCFPTLGVPHAGKTHWLAMLYWELGRGNYPKAVPFERIRSRSSDDFDVIVEEILISRLGTAATQRQRIPHPLVFNFRDRDRLSRSNILVNIFDYSGEVTSDMGVEDHRRRRALEGDGFFFFLDPTFPYQPQAQALAGFREDLRLLKHLKAGQRTRTPVALCVSKIDLLAAQPYALPDGGSLGARFYRELAQIDPTGEALTLKVIEARSRATARLRETIWPGWQIERQIDDLFGGRYLFFPLTPVGLDGRGESDLSLRTISPFGLLEPLLWLLQISGYPILE